MGQRFQIIRANINNRNLKSAYKDKAINLGAEREH